MGCKPLHVIYPGTFDPMTNGHLDIIERASALFDHITVAIACSPEKNPMFSIEQRLEIAQLSIKYHQLENVEVESFSGLLVEFAKQKKTKVLLRGLRAVSDFEYELQIGYTQKSLDPEIETVHLMSSLQKTFISSSIVRAVLRNKGDVSHLVCPPAYGIMKDNLCM